MAPSARSPAGGGPVAIRVVLTMAFALIISQFYRTAPATIAPDLVRDLGLTAERLGFATGTFHIAFAAMQIPVGVLLDRYGARRTVPSLLLVAVAGAWLFGTARGFADLVAGQALLGLGCSGVFMGGLVSVARWFPPERFATYAALIIGLSNLGNLVSATPLSAAAELLGWRASFQWLAGITLLIAAAVWLLVRDAPPGHPFHSRRPERLGETLRGVVTVFADGRLRWVLAMALIAYPTVLTVRGLWAGPYMHDVHGFAQVELGNVLLLLSVAMVAGVMLYGPLDRIFDSRKRVAIVGAWGGIAPLAALAVLPAPPAWLAVALMTAFILVGSHYVILQPHGRAFFPERMVGRAVTAINLSVFLGVAAMQWATGLIIGAFPAEGTDAPEAAFRAVFAFLAAISVVGLVAYSRAQDVRPSEERRLSAAPDGPQRP